MDHGWTYDTSGTIMSMSIPRGTSGGVRRSSGDAWPDDGRDGGTEDDPSEGGGGPATGASSSTDTSNAEPPLPLLLSRDAICT